MQVQREDELIKELPEKGYATIDLKRSIEPQLEKVRALLRKATVFLSYMSEDGNTAEAVRREFLARDYAVYDFQHIEAGADWILQTEKAIDESLANGFFIMLLSHRFVRSHSMQVEIDFAFKRAAAVGPGNNIIPIALDPVDQLLPVMPLELMALVGHIQFVDFSKGSVEENTRELISQLKTRAMG